MKYDFDKMNFQIEEAKRAVKHDNPEALLGAFYWANHPFGDMYWANAYNDKICTSVWVPLVQDMIDQYEAKFGKVEGSVKTVWKPIDTLPERLKGLGERFLAKNQDGEIDYAIVVVATWTEEEGVLLAWDLSRFKATHWTEIPK
jgi:hypothetical protein